MRPPRQTVVMAGVLAGALASVDACSASKPPPVDEQPTDMPTQLLGSGNDGGKENRESGATTDASKSSMQTEAGAVTPVTCESVKVEGQIVEELAVAGDMPPPLGGKIVPGTYILFELYDYPGDADAGGTTGLEARRTLFLGTTTYRLSDAEGTDDAGVGSAKVTGGTYRVADKALTWAQECPSLSTITNGYSAAGSQLGLYSGTHFAVYELQTTP
jgi:hypothetical protein